MARVFTLDFNYKGKSFTALVSQQYQGSDLSFLVRYLDQEIGHLLPGESLLFSLSEGLKSPVDLSSEAARDIASCTSEALTGYLQNEANV